MRLPRKRLFLILVMILVIALGAGAWLANSASSSADLPTIDQVNASCLDRLPSTAPVWVRGYLFLPLGQTSPPRKRLFLTLGFLWRSRHDRDARTPHSVITLMERTNHSIQFPATTPGRVDGDVTVHGQVFCTSPQPIMVIDRVTR